MASFPNAVKTFTTKTDGAGNSIFASHVNDLQDEVNAIEDGLRNGTAPLNSSNSTFAHVSAGHSTLGNLNGGDSTLSNLTVTGSLTLASTSRAACHVSHSVDQNVNTGTVTGLNFNTIRFDTQNMHSTSVNSSRITLKVPGIYVIGANVQWLNSSGGSVRELQLVVNDATLIADNEVSAVFATPIQHVTTTYQTTSTSDYVTVRVNQDSGSTMSIHAAAQYSPEFWVALVGM